MPRTGVLALQGDFQAHAAAFAELGEPPAEVRRPHELAELAGLVIPGGESTTLLNLMRDEPWFEALREFHASGGALFGTCAGAILLAREVRDPAQPSLALLDVAVQRNGYGRQLDSFETELDWNGDGPPLPAIFIRAPRFLEVGPDVEVLARHEGEAVLVQAGNVLAATFHPELTPDRRVQQRFIDVIINANESEGNRFKSGRGERGPAGPPAPERRVSC